jgi:hypothetical protein
MAWPGVADQGPLSGRDRVTPLNIKYCLPLTCFKHRSGSRSWSCLRQSPKPSLLSAIMWTLSGLCLGRWRSP